MFPDITDSIEREIALLTPTPDSGKKVLLLLRGNTEYGFVVPC